ncbi:MAG: hypothetical protein DWP98_11540 [Bacteroidetes bacterium]|nr:MAG: hypothetical protein DWP98_11540 [Bacteroidota bacterium]MBL1144033.1 hypothetical protein [Bacteroidota bacterium]NOG56833.1 hypothetical protein [Bacteroidota bacterium]
MKNKAINKLFKMLFLFGVSLAILDFSIGFALNYMTVNQKDGNYHKLINCIENKELDLVILGNSRAERQFIPSIISMETGLSAYNLGYGGRDLNFVDALTSVIVSRNPPKYLMVEFQLSNFRMPINQDRMSFLNPFYYRYPELQPFLNRGEISRKLAFSSSLFQFNSSLWDIVSPYFQKVELEQGYRPLYGKLKMNKPKQFKEEESEEEVEIMLPEIQVVFENIVAETAKNNIKLIVVLSPQFNKEHNENKFAMEKQYLNQFEDIIIWDYSQDSRFTEVPILFNDIRHLNHHGSQIFTKLIAERIKNELLN